MTAVSPTAPSALPRLSLAANPLLPRDESFTVARHLSDVLEAWHLVYQAYHENGLIEANSHRIHTMAPAISPRAAVCLSRRAGAVTATLTAVLDGPNGLPLDKVYGLELDTLRKQGRRPIEVCLLAHRWQTMAGRRDMEQAGGDQILRHKVTLVNLMRLVYAYALANETDDVVAGVHPRHAGFYCRAFGFKRVGEVRTYATVNHRPVILLHADRRAVFGSRSWPYALDFFEKHPLSAETFGHRYRFTDENLRAEEAAVFGNFLSLAPATDAARVSA